MAYGLQKEILAKRQATLDVVRRSWLTRLYNVVWRSGALPLD